MATAFDDHWLEAFMSVHGRGQPAGEDLRYEETFNLVKHQNTAVTPDAVLMLEKSAELLMRSADMRVCLYALHAAAILADAQSLVTVMAAYAYLTEVKFEESFPSGNAQKIACFEWCVKSFIVDHLVGKHVSLNPAQLRQIQQSLSALHRAILARAGEPVKWTDLEAWLEKQSQPAVRVPDPRPAPAEHKIESAKEARSLFDEVVAVFLKEKQYERAVGLARAHRWSQLAPLTHKDHKTALTIRQGCIDKVALLFDKQRWEEVIQESESLFMQPQAQFYFPLSRWSHEALMAINHPKAAEAILLHLKILLKYDGQIIRLMYNSGQKFADEETSAWINHHCSEQKENACQQDVSTMPVKSKLDRYLADFEQIKSLKSARKDLALAPAMQALFDRSLEDKLHDWSPELAESIWRYYAGILKEEKQQNKNNDSKTVWQAQWTTLTSTIAKIHVPAALDLMKQG